MDTKKAYKDNEEFKAYVDKYASKHGISVDVALTHYLIQEVCKHYTEKR